MLERAALDRVLDEAQLRDGAFFLRDDQREQLGLAGAESVILGNVQITQIDRLVSGGYGYRNGAPFIKAAEVSARMVGVSTGDIAWTLKKTCDYGFVAVGATVTNPVYIVEEGIDQLVKQIPEPK